MDTVSIDLGYLPSLGQLQLISAEWWDQDSRFVVFRYAIDERQQEFGIAMDIDKGALLDRVVDDDAALVEEQHGLEQCRVALWTIALEARRIIDPDIEPIDTKRTRQNKWTAMMEAVLEGSEARQTRSMI